MLFYIYHEKPTGKPGRPKLYIGKVDIKNPAMNHFKIVYQDAKIRIFSAIVFAKALGRKIKLALVQYLDEDGNKITNTKLYFSTNLNLSAASAVRLVYYQILQNTISN